MKKEWSKKICKKDENGIESNRNIYLFEQIMTENREQVPVRSGSEESIDTAKAELTDAQKKELQELKEQIKTTTNIEKQVDLYAKVMDDYGIDFLISTFLPELGDAGSSIVSGIFLLVQAKRVGLPLIDYAKIIVAQTVDLIGLVPVVGDILDYFIKANKRSKSLFTKHLAKLEEEAIKKGLSQAEIDNIKKDNATFMNAMNKLYDKAPIAKTGATRK